MSDVDDAPQAEIAVQIKNSKHLKQIGVAVRRPRVRRSCVKGQADEDTKHWELVLYAFSDSSELTNLETLLVQLVPSRCVLPADFAHEPLVGTYDCQSLLAAGRATGVSHLHPHILRRTQCARSYE